MLDCENMGMLIREHRTAMKMTQKELALALNVTDKAVSKWECGKCYPDVTIWNELSQILGIPISSFQICDNDADRVKRNKKAEIVLSIFLIAGVLFLLVYAGTNMKYHVKRTLLVSVVLLYYAVIGFFFWRVKKK